MDRKSVRGQMDNKNKMDQETLKKLNRQFILNHIRKYTEISRVDLARYTELSPTTVSTIIAELVAKKLVTELRVGESSGGRKPLMLGINPNARYVAGIILNQKGADFSVVNMNYETVYREHAAHKIEGSAEVQEFLINGIEKLLSCCSDIKDDICGFGISVPGVIDHENGKVLYSSKLHLDNFDLSAILNEKPGVKSFVFKDTDALILGEYKSGIGSASKNFIYINIEDGVGMSYIHSGNLMQPGYGGGLELGHITIDSNGPLCRCGNRGCLGAVVSEQPVISKLDRLCEKGYETFIGGDVKKVTLVDIVEFSNKGDRACRYVLEEQARVLGTAVASIVNIFNPQLIAIGGPLCKCEWGFLDILKDTVKDRALNIFSKCTEIDFAKLGEESALIGMANEIFEREVFNMYS
jgi:predicted NBD/HSP70 family sugar kinase